MRDTRLRSGRSPERSALAPAIQEVRDSLPSTALTCIVGARNDRPAKIILYIP